MQKLELFLFAFHSGSTSGWVMWARAAASAADVTAMPAWATNRR